MAARRIRQLGDPILREISKPVEAVEQVAPIVADLRDTLHEFRRTHGFGRGISAVQIGETKRLIYIEVDGVCYTLINPSYEFLSVEKFSLWDDCFSFPDLLVWLERSTHLGLLYTDELGAERRLPASGALSELIQHEMDHLDGILAIDRALAGNSLCTREEYLRRQAASRAAK